MNKTKIILLAIGGGALLGVLAFGFLIYGAWSGKGENGQELEYLESDAARLASLKIYPSSESIRATDDNRRAYADWSELAMGLASAGDMAFEPTTPASFKSFITAEAKHYSELKGLVNGSFVKPDFGFGFDEYILRGALPSAADLPRLQREWYDVSTFLNLLADQTNKTSVVELALVRAEVKPDTAPTKGKKKKQKKTVEESQPDITRFNIVFTATPAALVKVVNAIASNPRFIVAESCSFYRDPDELASKLGEKSAKPAAKTGGRHKTIEKVESADGEELTGLVADPESAPGFKVAMRVAVYDFRTKVASQDKEESK